MVLVSGEAGVGKTRLLEELCPVAESRGFLFLKGNSLYESVTPYMPIVESLRSGGLEHLFAEEAPRVEAVYLVTTSGLLVSEVVRKRTELSSDLFAGMLTAVSDFVKESMSKFLGSETEGALNTLGYENYRILIESGKNANLVVVVSGRENEFLIDDMRGMAQRIDSEYGEGLHEWDGETHFEGIEGVLSPLMTTGKYDGVYFGKEDPKARRNLLFQSVSLGLARQSEMKPTVLCIEDLQWADPSTMALMHHVAVTTKDRRLLVLGTYRPEDIPSDHALVETMQLMERDDLRNEVNLERLPREVMNEFLGLLGDFDFDDEFTSRVYSETEGNPLFIIQLMKYLVEDKIIEPHDGVWRLAASLEDVAIPSKVYNVILRRLNRVERDDRRLLDFACVNGEVFTSAVLAAALNARKSDVLERLRDLERTHKLITTLDGSFKFDHAKIKEVLYNEIPEELKREYHEIIADAIEVLNTDDMESVVGDLAFHYYHSRNGGKALSYLYEAAETAKEEYSNEEAIRFYNEALEFEDNNEKRVETLESVGDINLLMGNLDNSLESYREAIGLAGPRKKGRLMSKTGRIHSIKGQYDEALQLTTEALGLVEGTDCDDEAVVLVAIAACHYYTGNYEDALECYARGHVILESLGDRKGAAMILTNMGLMYHSMGDRDKGLEHYVKGLEKLEEIGDISSLPNSLNNTGVLYYERAELEKALECYERSLLIAEKIGDQKLVGDVTNNVGLVHMFKGEYEPALERFQKANDILGKIGKQLTFSETIWNMGHVYRAKGEYDKALEKYEEGFEVTEATNSPYDISLGYSSIGCAYRGKGEFEKAKEYHSKSLKMSEEVGWDLISTENYVSIARCYLSTGDLGKALDYCDRAIKLSEKEDLKEYTGMVRNVLGMIHREREEWHESTEDFTESIRILGEIGSRRRLGDSHYEFGKMWIAKGEGEEAKKHLLRAEEIYTEIRLDSKANETKSALESLHERQGPA